MIFCVGELISQAHDATASWQRPPHAGFAGKAEWPQAEDLNPQPFPPHGIEHHYALLGFASWPKQKLNIENARFEFWPLFSAVTQSEAGRDVRPPLLRPPIDFRDVPAEPAAPKKPPKATKRKAKKNPAPLVKGAPS